MDYRRENSFSSGNVVQILTGNSRNIPNDNWGADQAMWATEADYGVGNAGASVDTQLANEPPNMRSRNSQSDLTGPTRSKAIGKMFYKTKLCCKFRAGTCPYVTNCNFAHSIEELRKPPPNWQEIVAAHDGEQGVSSEPPREEFQIPILGVNDESQRSGKGRHCKRFFSEEGCPYGENCTFLHDEHSKTRESVTISLGPGVGGGYAVNVNDSILKPSNWKTRICNKWELTGYCPFGAKCHFAHGATELHGYGVGQLEGDGKGSSIPGPGVPPAKTSVDYSVSQMEIQSQRLANVIQKTERTHKWKGPDKISKVYGDWIDDL